MFGDIVSIIKHNTNEVLKTARWRDKGKENYIEHLGGINLTIVNDDAIAFGEKTMGLPSMGDIAGKFIPMDDKPKTKPDEHIKMELEVDKKAHKVEEAILKVLQELNTDKVSSAEVKNGLVDMAGTFLVNSGETTFNRTYIKYDYHDKSIFESLYGEEIDTEILAKRETGKIVVDNNLQIRPANTPPTHTGEWIDVSYDLLEKIFNATTFTAKVYLGDHLAYIPRFQMYFPFKYYINKQLASDYESKGGSDKYVIVENYRYRIEERKETYSTEFEFTLKHKDYKITITQIIDWVNMEAKKDVK